MKHHLSIPDRGSRFVQRWLAAKPEHAQELKELSSIPLAEVSFESLLQAQLALGITLPAAMRRFRNLLFSKLAFRDI